MGLLVAAVALLAALTLLAQLSSAVVVWEFGKDVPGSVVVFQKTGDIRLWNKVVDVPIISAPCMKVVYVRAEVQNPISNPAVSFKEATNTVLIEYGLLQSSKSWYEVVAKGKPTYCKGFNDNSEDDEDEPKQRKTTPPPKVVYVAPRYPDILDTYKRPEYPDSNIQINLRPNQPDSKYPDSRYPEPNYSENRYPDSRYPEPQNPQNRYPDQRYPEPQNPQNRYPDQRYPEPQNPQNRYPDSRYPDSRYPDPRYPEPKNPQNRYPDSRYPDPNNPQDGYPDSRYPDPKDTEHHHHHYYHTTPNSEEHTTKRYRPSRDPYDDPPVKQDVTNNQITCTNCLRPLALEVDSQ